MDSGHISIAIARVQSVQVVLTSHTKGEGFGGEEEGNNTASVLKLSTTTELLSCADSVCASAALWFHFIDLQASDRSDRRKSPHFCPFPASHIPSLHLLLLLRARHTTTVCVYSRPDAHFVFLSLLGTDLFLVFIFTTQNGEEKIRFSIWLDSDHQWNVEIAHLDIAQVVLHTRPISNTS